MDTSTEEFTKPKTKTKPAPNKTKTPKKRKSSDGATCSMFLSEMTRRLMNKRKSEDKTEEDNVVISKNIVQTVIENINNALPVKLSKKSLKAESPVLIETLQNYAPELLSKDTLSIPGPVIDNDLVEIEEEEEILPSRNQNMKMPKMPITSSEMLKKAVTKNTEKVDMEVMAVSPDNDVASELVKHVGTLKKISLIAEEFNQRTAKNLKEIVDSVQEDLMKKLEELKKEQLLLQTMPKIQEQGTSQIES